MVRFEVKNNNTILLQEGTIHNTLHKNLLPFQSGAKFFTRLQNGEFELPQALRAGPEFLTDLGFEEYGNLFAIYQSALLRCQKTAFHQPGNFPGNPSLSPAAFKTQILHDRMHGTSPGKTVRTAPQEGRTAVGAWIKGFGPGILGSLFILFPTLFTGCRLFGGSTGGFRMGVLEGKTPAKNIFTASR